MKPPGFYQLPIRERVRITTARWEQIASQVERGEVIDPALEGWEVYMPLDARKIRQKIQVLLSANLQDYVPGPLTAERISHLHPHGRKLPLELEVMTPDEVIAVARKRLENGGP